MSLITSHPISSQENATAKVFPFTRREIEVPSLSDQDQGTRRIPRKDKIVKPFIDSKPISSLDKEIINDAFELISTSLDINLYASERSNSFDAWKDSLDILSRKIEYFENNHRKILGALISTTKYNDISDFSDSKGLQIFQEATNALRRPRLIKIECMRIISQLLELKANTMIPLFIEENSPKAAELEELMGKLIEKSKHGT